MKLIWHDFKTIDSTHSCAKNMVENSILENTLLITSESQTNGYGTKQNVWESPKGNLYATFCIQKQAIALRKDETISIFTANLLKQAIYALTAIETTIKHPNDIMLNEKKCAGILCSIETDKANNEIFCISMGCNTKIAPKTNQPTTAIKCDRKMLILEWIEQLKKAIKQF